MANPVGIAGSLLDPNTDTAFPVNVAVTCKLFTGSDPIPRIRKRGGSTDELFFFFRDDFNNWNFVTAPITAASR